MADRFTLAQLRCFVAVAETLSFRQAAEDLRMTQPPLTRQIQALERAMGAELLDRGGKRIALTAAGHVLFEDATRILHDIDRCVLNVRDAAATGRRSLTVAYQESAEHDILPVTLSVFRRSYPEVHVHLTVRGTFDAEDALLAGEVDVAFLRPPTRSPEVELTLVQREPLVAVLPAEHPLAGHEIDLIDLRDEQFIGFSRTLDDTIRTAVLNACVTAGFTPRYGAKTTSIPMLLSMVASGQGITLLSRSWTRTVREGLAYAPLRDQMATSVLAVAVQRGRSSSLTDAFVAASQEAAEILAPKHAAPRPSTD